MVSFERTFNWLSITAKFQYIKVNWCKIPKVHKYVCIEIYKMKLTRFIQMGKNKFSKNGINSFNFSCTGYRKRLWIRNVLCVEMTRKVFFS